MAYMTDVTKFIEDADDTMMGWSGILRENEPDPDHAQTALFVCVDRDFETTGPVLFAIASAGTDLGHVAISVHAFRDGNRVEPEVVTLGDEIIITLKNGGS